MNTHLDIDTLYTSDLDSPAVDEDPKARTKRISGGVFTENSSKQSADYKFYFLLLFRIISHPSIIKDFLVLLAYKMRSKDTASPAEDSEPASAACDNTAKTQATPSRTNAKPLFSLDEDFVLTFYLEGIVEIQILPAFAKDPYYSDEDLTLPEEIQTVLRERLQVKSQRPSSDIIHESLSYDRCEKCFSYLVKYIDGLSDTYLFRCSDGQKLDLVLSQDDAIAYQFNHETKTFDYKLESGRSHDNLKKSTPKFEKEKSAYTLRDANIPEHLQTALDQLCKIDNECATMRMLSYNSRGDAAMYYSVQFANGEVFHYALPKTKL